MRMNAKRRIEWLAKIREWLDENGPATIADISKGLGCSYNTVQKLLRTKPDWLVSPGYICKRYAKIVLYASGGEHVLGQCGKCKQRNFHHGSRFREVCVRCSMGARVNQEYGYTDEELADIDPWRPSDAGPGKEEKVKLLAKRYADGVPFWNDEDADFTAYNRDLPEEHQEYVSEDDEDLD